MNDVLLFFGGALTLAAGIAWGYVLAAGRNAPPLTLAPRAHMSAEAVNAQIPIPNTTYEPVYLSDAAQARLMRGLDASNNAVAHESLEATRR